MYEHIFNSIRQEIADEKNLARMVKEMDRTYIQGKTTEEELSKIRIINNAVRQKLQREEEKCIQEEERIKVSIDRLEGDGWGCIQV